MRRVLLSLAVCAGLAACTVGEVAPPPSDTPRFPQASERATTGPVTVAAPQVGATATLWRAAGATVDGTVTVAVRPVAVDLARPAAWLIAAATGNGGTLWVAVHDDGTVSAVTVDAEGRVADADVGAATTSASRPPSLHAPDGDWLLVHAPDDAAEHAGVLPLGDGTTVTIAADGDLLVTAPDAGFPERYPGPYLPDARPVLVDERRVAVLFGPTDRYDHAVLGDGVEATQARIVDVTAGTVTDVVVPEGRVIEGVQPIVADLSDDGALDMVVTTSTDADGARLEAWLLAGRGRRIGPALGQGGRWRHQVAVAPTGPGGEVELVEVQTPHVERIATFWRPNEQLLVATGDVADAVVSHRSGSRSMEDAAVVDIDGDGIRELLGPAVDGGLAVVRHLRGDTTVERLDVPAPESNLAITALPGGRAALGYVTGDGLLVAWIGGA